jgi:hypothetical protein
MIPNILDEAVQVTQGTVQVMPEKQIRPH